jgi:hypothetical protein
VICESSVRQFSSFFLKFDLNGTRHDPIALWKAQKQASLILDVGSIRVVTFTGEEGYRGWACGSGLLRCW